MRLRPESQGAPVKSSLPTDGGMHRAPASCPAVPKPNTSGPNVAGPLAAKVPEVGVLFWIVKVLTTGMGESMSDFLGQHSVPLAALLATVGLGVALRLQLRATEYRAPTYWFAVMMVAVFGTMAADGVHKGTSVPYTVTTPLFAAVVAVVFLVWQRTEGTLSIHTITTRRRERFYWVAVLATFALGTAAGDLTAISLNLGFPASVALFAVLIAVPAIGWWLDILDPILAFWSAYVVTRPLGASIADWLAKPAHGGLGLGDGTVSLMAFVVFVGFVAYLAVTKRDIQPAVHGHPHPHLPHSLPDVPAVAQTAEI
jgi:uncharacterized membrane-anchored protein